MNVKARNFRFVFALVLGSVILVSGCNSRKQHVVPPKSELEDVNRLLVKKEAFQIEQYVKRMQWPAEKSATGIYYYVYNQSEGRLAKVDDMVKVRMLITLLNGDTCYDWRRYGDEEFIIERDNNESGLHEVLPKMRVGEKAKIVLPSYLAFGVAGDRDRIPPRHSVVYDLELVAIKP